MSLEKDIESLESDINELKKFNSLSERDTVKRYLQQEINRLEVKQANIRRQVSSFNEITDQMRSTNTVTKSWKEVKSYSWLESEKYVKIYITIDEKQEINEKDIELTFPTDNSIQLTFGSSKFTLRNLYKKIKTNDSYFKLGKGKLSLFLRKTVDNETWGNLQMKKDDPLASKTKNEPEDEKMAGDDPQASLMNLMKKMYDEGDDEMKRTISKTWYESMSGKGKTPDMNLPDFNA